MEDMFLEGNELIEEAIEKFYAENSEQTLINILEAVRQRMHEDGHFILPVRVDEEDDTRFAFQTIESGDGKVWNAAFTSPTEYEKGEKCDVVSYFIDSTMKFTLESDVDGVVINPWGKPFMLAKELIEMIFNADGDTEYAVPDDQITEDLLKGGAFLKRATEICNRNRTQLNLIKVARILRDSYVWIPCSSVLSERDQNRIREMIESKEDPSLLKGETWQAMDEIRMVPDILQNGDEFFFPVFSSEEEMGEYGESFSKVEKHFLEALILAGNNEKNVAGIVINAFSEPFVVPREMFDIIAGMESSIKDN